MLELVTIIVAEAEQLFALVFTTEYVPAPFTVIVCVVAPVFHKFPEVILLDKTTEAPGHKLVEPPADIVKEGS